jgi:hypothetical protein
MTVLLGVEAHLAGVRKTRKIEKVTLLGMTKKMAIVA